MMKKIAAAAITATILVGFQAQAHAFLGVNGVALNGINHPNGVALNGINHPNGVEPSGRETYLVDRHPGGEGSTVLAITLPQARVTR